MPTRPTMASKSTRPAPPAPKHFRRHLLWHTWIRIVYKLFGLAPQSRCLIAWTVAQLTALIVYVCTLVTMRARIFDLFDTIGIYNAVFKGSTLLVTHLFILGEALYARASHRAVSAGLAEIDRICKRKRFGGRFGGGANGDYIGRAHSRNALVFWAYACLAIGSEAIIVGTVSRTPVWKLFWLATVVSVAVSRLRHLQHAMCVRGLTARVRIVRKALGRIAEAGLDDTAQAAERLAELQMLAGAVYEISSHMERIFGLSQLLNLMQNFVQLLCDLYWLYSMLHINELHALTEIIINLIPTVLALVILMEACEDCMHQVKFMGYYLHRINERTCGTKINTLVENFSLQLLHSPVQFRVIGFFNMDFVLLKSMVAAITTYMVIMIQFMPNVNDGEGPDSKPSTPNMNLTDTF